MKYCLDTSALVSLGERHYPAHLPVFAPIWDHLYQGIDHNGIISVDFVKIELEKKADDWRKDFILRADKMFRMSEEVEHEYGSIVGEIEARNDVFLVNKQRDRFMIGADPWVIALARNVDGCTVVSGETKKLADYGLGEVCKELRVRHLNLIQFFEENKIGA
ncbi:MAG: DUF4411 family protein [Nitrosomonadales bacterium]|nr:DUF4411 family protein [Nitrosomonadales bacterium]